MKILAADHIIYNIIKYNTNIPIKKVYSTKSLFIPTNDNLESNIHPQNTDKHLRISNKHLQMYINNNNYFENYTNKYNGYIKLRSYIN